MSLMGEPQEVFPDFWLPPVSIFLQDLIAAKVIRTDCLLLNETRDPAMSVVQTGSSFLGSHVPFCLQREKPGVEPGFFCIHPVCFAIGLGEATLNRFI